MVHLSTHVMSVVTGPFLRRQRAQEQMPSAAPKPGSTATRLLLLVAVPDAPPSAGREPSNADAVVLRAEAKVLRPSGLPMSLPMSLRVEAPSLLLLARGMLVLRPDSDQTSTGISHPWLGTLGGPLGEQNVANMNLVL